MAMLESYLIHPSRRGRKKTLARILVVLGLSATAWIATGAIVFALRHPELTDTQRLLRLWDALMFR